MQQHSIGIIGGGLVGSFAALSLAKQGFNVALIDPAEAPHQAGKIPDLRVSAITPASWSLLNLNPARFGKILSMKIFENEDNPLHFYASEVGRDQLGAIVENNVLLQAIQAEFPENVHKIPQKCESFKRNEAGFALKLGDQTLQVHFLILAQGHDASLAQTLGIPFTIFDYQEEALVFHVETEKPHQNTAYQRFLPSGPLAFLPLYQDHWCSIVWTLPRTQAKALKALSKEKLAAALLEAFPALGSLQIISEVASFPMYAQDASKVSGKGFVLMGDAAHTVHPLAGQGVNLGFRDVAAFCKVLQTCKLDDPALPDHYRKATLRYNRIMSRGFSLIHYFYSTAGLSKLRQLGAKYLDRIIPIKKELMKFAMGERGRQ